MQRLVVTIRAGATRPIEVRSGRWSMEACRDATARLSCQRPCDGGLHRRPIDIATED